MIDVALAVVRVVVGLLIAGHGVQKLTKLLGGSGLDQHAANLESLGYRPPRFWAAGHGVAELGAGLLLATGLATPLASALIIAVMINAVAFHAPKGLWTQNGGFEYPLVLAVLAAGFALAGPGSYSLDALLALQPDTTWAVGALIAGLVLGVAALATRRVGRVREPVTS